jgi:hypothetical protein
MLTPPLIASLPPGLLAQADRLQGMSQRFQSGGNRIDAVHVAMLVVALLGVGGVLWKLARLNAQREGASFNSPRRLFRDLCRFHQLDWPSRRLLWRLARSHQLEHPARVFIEPAWFDAQRLPSSLRSYNHTFAQLQTQLFSREDDRTAPAEPARWGAD